ncbi:MAG: hypothetical protein KDA80_09110 [Planctomycetaceae bacterium]|nr:hypothetical protein [Planctomycetaceae bacterium]
MNIHPTKSTLATSRTGSLIPALGVAILLAGAGMALVLNQVWLTNAQAELRHSAEAAALAAARTLVDDSLLLTNGDTSDRRGLAEVKAQQLAETSPVVNRPAVVELRFGRVAVSRNTGNRDVLETNFSPDTVMVWAFRDQAHGNPVGMLMPAFTGRFDTDVRSQAEASINNLVRSVRPYGKVPVPVWPLAVREEPIPDSPLPAWIPHIEEQQGPDNLRWDESQRKIVHEADGLPEIRLQSKLPGKPGNLVQILIAGMDSGTMEYQFANGWSPEDLKSYGGEFPVAPDDLVLTSTREIDQSGRSVLEQQIGQVRLIALYAGDAGEEDAGEVQVTRLVAARLMECHFQSEGVELVLQPSVMATRMAVLDEEALYHGDVEGSRYLYRLSLTQ